MAEPEKKEPGLVRQIVEVFKGKMAELEPVHAAVVFIVLAIIFTFGVIGFTSAIASGVVKLVQVIGAVAASGAIPIP